MARGPILLFLTLPPARLPEAYTRQRYEPPDSQLFWYR
jgi:hypothetical protein